MAASDTPVRSLDEMRDDVEATRVRVLDLGSNTFHLLVADVRGRAIREVLDVKEGVRLGDGAFTRGALGEEAWRRGREAVERLLSQTGCDPREVRVVATGVFREVRDGREFLDAVERRHGVTARLLSGEDEARLTWWGVRSELEEDDGVALIDVGGGSLEVAFGYGDALTGAESLPLGVLRLRDRFAIGSGPLGPELAAEILDYAGAIARRSLEALRARGPRHVVLSSGTARALLRLARQTGAVTGATPRVGREALAALATRLAGLDAASILALGVPANRADTIAVGALVVSRLVGDLGALSAVIATRALREGVAFEAAHEAPPTRSA